MEEATGLEPVKCGFESHVRYQTGGKLKDSCAAGTVMRVKASAKSRRQPVTICPPSLTERVIGYEPIDQGSIPWVGTRLRKSTDCIMQEPVGNFIGV